MLEETPTARRISQNRTLNGCSRSGVGRWSFLKNDSERQRLNYFRSISRSIKTKELLKLWRQFYLRSDVWGTGLLV